MIAATFPARDSQHLRACPVETIHSIRTPSVFGGRSEPWQAETELIALVLCSVRCLPSLDNTFRLDREALAGERGIGGLQTVEFVAAAICARASSIHAQLL